jgi:hypothetical protein
MSRKTGSKWGTYNPSGRANPIYWGENCSSPMGKELVKLWTSDTVKPLAKHIATVLGTTEHAVKAAVARYKLKRHPRWSETDARQKKSEAVSVETPKLVIYGNKPSLPPLPSLQFVFDEKTNV